MYSQYFQAKEIYDFLELKFKLKVIAPTIIRYETMTPDSSALLFVLHNAGKEKFYILYSEDYIGDLTSVSSIIHDWYGQKPLNFIEVRIKRNFEDMAPSRWYKGKPPEWETLYPYIAESSYASYFSLLAEVPKPNDGSYWDVAKTVPFSDLPPQLQDQLPKASVDPSVSFLDRWKVIKSNDKSDQSTTSSKKSLKNND